MKFTPIFCLAAVMTLGVSGRAQVAPAGAETPALAAKRVEHLRSMKRAEIASLTAYIHDLEPMRVQYVREGKTDAAQAVDLEIKSAKKQLDAAVAGSDITRSPATARRIVSRKIGNAPAPASTVPALSSSPFDETANASVTAITIPSLQTPQFQEIESLSGRAPDFSISSTSLHSFGDIYAIRGVTGTPFYPGPAMYVDGVPQGDTFAFFQPLYDIDKIDIFRGPQPALFGLNSNVGLIDIETRHATNEWHGDASASYASFNTQQYRLSLSGPLVKNQLYISAAGNWDLSDGFIYDNFLKRRTDSRNDLSGRLVLTWTPAPDWEFTAGVEGGRAKDGSSRFVSLAASNPLEVSSDIPGSLSIYQHQEWLDVTKRFESWQARTIFSHSDYQLNPQDQDLDFSPVSATTAGIFPGVQTGFGQAAENRRYEETWSAELRFESTPQGPAPAPASDGKSDANTVSLPASSPDRFHWRTGLFFQERTIDENDVSQSSFPFVIAPPPPELARELALFGLVFPTSPETQYLSFASRDQFALRRDTLAEYATAGYTWGPLDIEAGARAEYNRDRVWSGFFPYRYNYGELTAAPTLGLTFHLTKSVDLFARTTYGVIPGGLEADLSKGKQERDWASETGVHVQALGGKLQTTLTGYYSRIEHYQIPELYGGLENYVYTAQYADSYGVEFESAYELMHGLAFSGNIGYNETTVHFQDDPSTERAPYAPNFTALAALDYAVPCGFRARVEYVVMGDTIYPGYTTDYSYDARFRQNAYGLLNAEIGYKRGLYSVSLFGTNLADKRYFVMKESDIDAGVVGQPRMLGVKAELEF